MTTMHVCRRLRIGLALLLLGSCKDARSEATEATQPASGSARAPSSAAPDGRLATGSVPEGWRGPLDADEKEALLRAEKASQALLSTLMQRLAAAMGEAGGLGEAVRVCAAEAQVLTQEVAGAHGVALGRSSKRLRNPENAPPPWVAEWLAAHDGQPAAELEAMAGIVEKDGRRLARRVAPIGMQPLCLSCHGPEETIAPEVRAILAQRYPHDEATGYAIGDLRGAVWAELAMGEPSP